jgi:hypothetical protein
MSFTGGDDPVELRRRAAGHVQRLPQRFITEREFVLFRSCIRERLDPRALPQFTQRHPEGAVHFRRWHASRTQRRGPAR